MHYYAGKVYSFQLIIDSINQNKFLDPKAYLLGENKGPLFESDDAFKSGQPDLYKKLNGHFDGRKTPSLREIIYIRQKELINSNGAAQC